LQHEFEQALQIGKVESEFGGFDDQDFTCGPGQWRGLEIGNCEEEAASSAGSEATYQIEETTIST
jgi:hypothetical protein